MRPSSILTVALAVVAASCTGGGTFAYYRYLPPGRSLPGAYIAGGIQPERETLGDFLERRRRLLGEREIYLQLPDETRRFSFADLGLELDVAKTMERARADAEDGPITQRLYRAWQARYGGHDVPGVWTVDEAKARMAIKKLSKLVYRDPVDARLDLVGHRRIEEEPGRELDVDLTLAMLRDADTGDGTVVPIGTKTVPAQVTTAMLADIDVGKVAASYETNFGGTGKGRAVNIATAAKYLNGTVVGPLQTISFNDVVGARTLERGFTWAPVIKDDELEPGVGGGTCQVASTVHAAAVYAGLEIVQRRSHSRPSSYTKLGLDATVVWGEVDLKVKNPFDTPLIVHAFIPPEKPTYLRVEFLGREAPGEVEYSYGVARSYEFYRRVTTKPWLKDRQIKRQRGHRGYDVTSIVKIKKPSGELIQKSYFSSYRPVPEVFWVGPDFQLTELPELPQGAERVEVNGKRDDVLEVSAIPNPYESGT